MGRELENNDASYLDLLTAAARKASPGQPMTLGSVGKAKLRLIAWCRDSVR